MLPLEQAELLNDLLDDMHITLLSAIDETGSKQRRYLTELAKSEQEVIGAVDRYEKAYSIVTQPMMQDLLQDYGALEDQMTREQNAIRDVKHDHPLLKSVTDRIVGLVKGGKKDEAVAIFSSKASSPSSSTEIKNLNWKNPVGDLPVWAWMYPKPKPIVLLQDAELRLKLFR